MKGCETIVAILIFALMQSVHSKVLLISMDGFRWDYIARANTPNFDRMAQNGTHAKYINSTFITKTFPCHYTIATGLYEESHGIVANHMYDHFYPNETFGPRTKTSKWWDGGEPLWVTVQRHGLRSAVFFWPGSYSEIRGKRPNIWKEYNETIPFIDRVDTVVEWLTNTSLDIDLAFMYFHEPDRTGHKYGPSSQHVIDKVADMDILLGYIIQKFDDNDMWENVNMLLTSDHGMADVDSSTRRIELSTIIDMSAVQELPEYGPIVNILPVAGRGDELIQNLSNINHMSVYKKEDIPDHWHYKHNRRILPILLVADQGWLILKSYNETPFTDKGTHGYDNRLMSMKPIFYARGPNIKPDFQISPFNSVDIYPLVCELLGISPSENNGTLDNTQDMLVNIYISSAGQVTASVIITIVVLLRPTFI